MDARLNHLFLSFILITCINVSGQDNSSINLKVDLLVDSMWDLNYNQVENFKSISHELIRIGDKYDNHKAKVNGAQGLGEYYHRTSDFENAHLNYSKAREIAINGKDKREEGHTLMSLASIAYDRNRFEEMEEYFLLGINNWQELKDTNQLCYSHLKYSQKLSSLDEHSNAINKFLKGCDYCKIANNQRNYAACLSGMSVVHKKQKNLSKAIELSNEALNISREIKDNWAICTELNNLGILNKDIKNYSKARLIYDEGFALSKTFGHPPLEKSFMVNIGILDNLENKYESALNSLKNAYPIARSEKDLVSISDILNEISKSYIGLNFFQIANDTIKSAIRYAQSTRSLEKEWQAWNTQYLIYKNLEENDLALNALERYQVINDSIYRIEKTAEIDRLQTEFETKEQEQEIQHLESQAILDASRKKWLSVGLVGLSLAALAIIYSIVLKRKKDRKLHQATIELKDSENKRLEEALHHKRKELTEKALHLAQKNELLSSLKNDLKSLKNEENETEVKVLSNKIRFDEQMNHNWEQFLIAFKDSKEGFFKSLSSKHPEVSKNDLRLSALLSMNLGSKEIASILNISDMGVKKARYRLRKKLNLNSEDNLEQYLAKL